MPRARATAADVSSCAGLADWAGCMLAVAKNEDRAVEAAGGVWRKHADWAGLDVLDLPRHESGSSQPHQASPAGQGWLYMQPLPRRGDMLVQLQAPGPGGTNVVGVGSMLLSHVHLLSASLFLRRGDQLTIRARAAACAVSAEGLCGEPVARAPLRVSRVWTSTFVRMSTAAVRKGRTTAEYTCEGTAGSPTVVAQVKFTVALNPRAHCRGATAVDN